ALQRVARGTRYARAALPVSLQTHETDDATASGDAAAAGAADPVDSPPALLPSGVAAALAAEQDEQATATAEAVARLTAARGAEIAESAEAPTIDTATPKPKRLRLRNSLRRRRIDKSPDDDEPDSDPSTESSRFA
ncbi:conserved hypothetical protein, partial [Burkholderia sp. H160]